MACTLGCICLAACAEPQGESSPSPLPTSIPASTTATTSISPTVEAATEVLLNYVDEENIVGILPSDINLQIGILYPHSTGEDTPEDWDNIIDNMSSTAQAFANSSLSDDYDNIAIQLFDADNKIIMGIVNKNILYSAYGGNSAAYNPPTISLEEYNSIQIGMTYQEVVDIIGSTGEALAEVDLGIGHEYYTNMLMWEGEGIVGANANIMFQDGKVIQKAQFGLE